MRKILTLGLLALPTALITDRPASAWTNTRFSIGLNWSRQSGGNNFLWGAFRNGQPPCPDVAYPGGYSAGHYNTFPGFQPPYGPQDFQYFGKKNGSNNTTPAQSTPSRVAPAGQQAADNSQVSWYGNAAYQPASYSYGTNNPYYYYSYPQTYYGYQVPSYWYGR